MTDDWNDAILVPCCEFSWLGQPVLSLEVKRICMETRLNLKGAVGNCQCNLP